MEDAPEHYLPVCLPSPEPVTTMPSVAAVAFIRTSRADPPKLADMWGLTLQQVFDIQDGID